jgi:hypothetical protein
MTLHPLCRAVFLLGLVLAVTPAAARADIVTDPVGDFIPSFAGRHNGDLDVVSAEVRFDGSSFFLRATMNGAIGTTSSGLYVLGFNRGAGTAGFAAIGIDKMLFDRVIVINNNDTSPTAGVTVSHSGNDLFATIPLAAVLPSTGFAPRDYTWNLWPRDPVNTVGAAAISDFAPDNSNAALTVVPAPPAVVLAGIGAAGLWGRRVLARKGNVE